MLNEDLTEKKVKIIIYFKKKFIIILNFHIFLNEF